jgi:PAS domain S-box-containing protein
MNASMPGARILVVEDEGITAKHIESRLTGLGYEVPAIAQTGAEAIEKAEQIRPDLVLMDIQLKGEMDGVQAARQLSERFGVPVTYLTAFADDATLARAQDTAPYGYVVKPFGERELHAAIQMALTRRRLERAVEEGQRWLSTILGAVRDGIIATDRDGAVRFMNPVAESLTGWRQSEALGKELAAVFRTTPLEEAKVEEDPRQHDGQRDRVRLLRRGGKATPIEVSATTARDHLAEIAGFVWAFRDVSARLRAEEKLREREAHFRSLIENASDIIGVLDPDGTIYYASPSVQKRLGRDPADLLGTNVFDLVHPEDAPAAMRKLREAAAEAGKSTIIDVRVRGADGSWRVFESMASRHVDDELGPRIVLNARDVTERKEAEAKLKDELELTDAVARVSRELIGALGSAALLDRLCRVMTEVLHCDFSHTWIKDADEEAFLSVAGHGDTSEQWESMRALKVPLAVVPGLVERLQSEGFAEIVMSRPQELLPPSLPGKYGITLAMYVALRRGGDLVGIQTAGYRGREIPFSATQRRIGEAVAQIASLVLEQSRLMEEMEHTSALKSDLMAVLSHELRAPVGNIAGFADLFLNGEFGALTSEQRSHLEMIKENAVRMQELIRGTLEVNQVERRRVYLDLREVPVADLVAEIEREAHDLPRHSGVEVTWEVAPDLPVLTTDPLKLKIALKNLVANALKYTREGSVRVFARASGDGLEFEVRDTGVGIPAEAQEYIFEPFRRVQEAASADNGVGLGLYIARRMLESLEGEVSVDSTPGRGSVFRLRIPRRVRRKRA